MGDRGEKFFAPCSWGGMVIDGVGEVVESLPSGVEAFGRIWKPLYNGD